MLYIAYRGLFEGENPQAENTPNQIGLAFNNGFAVMVDVWRVDNKLYLGSDQPITEVSALYLQGKKFWLNLRNSDAQSWFPTQSSRLYPQYFHQTVSSEPYVTVSDGRTWVFSEFQQTPVDNQSVMCQPEIPDRGLLSTVHYKNYGVCSMFCKFIKRIRQEGNSMYNWMPF